MNLLLTSSNPGLIQGLARIRPDLEPIVLGSAVPDDTFDAPVLCFVDWLMPELSGLEMIRRLRTAPATRNGHITMVLESSDPEDQRRALRAGADDYLVGPLNPERVASRIDSLAAAQGALPRPNRLVHGDLVIDVDAHQARYRDRLIALRPNEFRLLAHFAAHPDRVFNRTALIERIGKNSEALDERTVDVWVGRLRRALVQQDVPDPLRTVRSLGYVLDSLRDRL